MSPKADFNNGLSTETPDVRSLADGVAFVEGKYIPVVEATIPLLDRGFIRSDATYDVVHVWNGHFFRLDDHIERFFRSMTEIRLSTTYSRQQIKDILVECVRLSGLREAYVQMTCTRGIPPSGTRDPRLCKNRFIAHVLPFIWIADEEQRRRGLRLTVSSVQRIDPQSVDPRVKNFHWLDLTRGMFEALDRGDEVAVLVDRNGHLTEGAGFNLFLVHDGKVSTPAANVFEGMTRRTVMELCKEMDIACVLETIPADRIRDADEVFLTSTAGGIMPVATVDGKPVGRESHVVTTRIHDLYWSRQTGGELSTPISYDVI